MGAAKPTKATGPDQACTADPGSKSEIEAREKRPLPHKPEEEPAHWIEVRLVDEADKPVVGEMWEVLLPNGRIARGVTNKEGVGRVSGIKPGGSCKVSFPRLDKGAWEEA